MDLYYHFMQTFIILTQNAVMWLWDLTYRFLAHLQYLPQVWLLWPNFCLRPKVMLCTLFNPPFSVFHSCLFLLSDTLTTLSSFCFKYHFLIVWLMYLLPGEGHQHGVRFDDPSVCKSFLLSCCPHDILSSTVSC